MVATLLRAIRAFRIFMNEQLNYLVEFRCFSAVNLFYFIEMFFRSIIDLFIITLLLYFILHYDGALLQGR